MNPKLLYWRISEPRINDPRNQVYSRCSLPGELFCEAHVYVDFVKPDIVWRIDFSFSRLRLSDAESFVVESLEFISKEEAFRAADKFLEKEYTLLPEKLNVML